VINHLLNPVYSSVKEEVYEEDYFATIYYLQAGEYDIALGRAQKAALSKSAKGWEALGRVYQSIAGTAANDSLRNLYNDYAVSSYRASNDLKESIAANNGLGSILFRQGNIVGATEYFEQSLKMEPDDINTLMNVAECYKARVNEENGIEKVLKTYRMINRINPDNPNILLQLGAAYTRAGDCSNAREILKKVDGFQGFSPEQQQTVTNCLRQCAN
jgi:tetratricopeptide (TPR) repeat protein